jgi:hypothetical protein
VVFNNQITNNKTISIMRPEQLYIEFLTKSGQTISIECQKTEGGYVLYYETVRNNRPSLQILANFTKYDPRVGNETEVYFDTETCTTAKSFFNSISYRASALHTYTNIQQAYAHLNIIAQRREWKKAHN